MAWFVAFIIALGIWVTVFPLYALTQHDNKEEAKQSAIEIWKEANNTLLTMTRLKKLARYYMVIWRKTFHFFSNL